MLGCDGLYTMRNAMHDLVMATGLTGSILADLALDLIATGCGDHRRRLRSGDTQHDLQQKSNPEGRLLMPRRRSRSKGFCRY